MEIIIGLNLFFLCMTPWSFGYSWVIMLTWTFYTPKRPDLSKPWPFKVDQSSVFQMTNRSPWPRIVTRLFLLLIDIGIAVPDSANWFFVCYPTVAFVSWPERWEQSHSEVRICYIILFILFKLGFIGPIGIQFLLLHDGFYFSAAEPCSIS